MTELVGLGVLAGIAVLGVPVPRLVVLRRARGVGRRRGATGGDDDLELSAVVTLAAAQLRAGAAPSAAWARALGWPVGRVPTVEQLVGRAARRRRGHDALAQRAAAVVAAARLSDDLGAPLATVLDRVAIGLAADEECEGERTAALAGPRATAQVLAWLPLLGLVLGVALGAHPVQVVLAGGVGTAAAVVGAVLVVLGRWWTRALLARAERADTVPRRRPRNADRGRRLLDDGGRRPRAPGGPGHRFAGADEAERRAA
ncbi:type II secretion protein F [Cellulomonas sp. URHD0024]|uniref:type II secretion protein F n=1 Tax=Cellulomonas sp. URHD0024 TaxID=1302620 RepID=UPI00041CA8BA|nr:type II secretion protein F [Cellulomonas sp. URHD0024]